MRNKPNGRTVFAALVAMSLCLGIAGMLPPASPALAEDNSPNTPPPKPKDPQPPPPDPCAGSKMKSACRNAEAVRALLREAPPVDPKPLMGEAGSADTEVGQ
jgi:hypothetical protein